MKTLPVYRVYWGRITFAAAAAFALASIPAVLNGQWARFGTGTALAAIGALIAVLFFNLGRASATADRAYQVELARGTNADKDPFADQLCVEQPTYDVTVGRDTHPAVTLDRLTELQLANDVPAYLAVEQAGDTTVGGTRITWQPSTHTTGDPR